MAASTAVATSLRLERTLLRSGSTLVCGVDEVGRGALSGPVTVGMVLVDARTRSLAGVRDSKLLSAATRTTLVPRIRRWAVGTSVGHASAAEIDEVGIIGALRRAGLRALAALPVAPDAILLDGSHDWLSSPRQGSLLDEEEPVDLPPVTMRVKADMTCTSVAAASVLAKVARDAIMLSLDGEHPAYGWSENKGYASPEHLAALRTHGACAAHRRSWNLPVSAP